MTASAAFRPMCAPSILPSVPLATATGAPPKLAPRCNDYCSGNDSPIKRNCGHSCSVRMPIPTVPKRYQSDMMCCMSGSYCTSQAKQAYYHYKAAGKRSNANNCQAMK
eukprot:2568071-Amphidinium_carterae.1